METLQVAGIKWTILQMSLLSLCLLNSKADSHILVYRTLTNQLIEEYNDLPAQFGPSLPPNGLKVFAIPAQHKADGCNKIEPPPRAEYPDNAKFVVIIERGGENCTFELKVRHAQTARFDAVIVYNNDGDDLEQMSAQNSSGIYIPSVFVGRTSGINLKSFLTKEVVLVINDELPFNINTQLILPFSILIGICFLIMILYMIYKCVREERRLRRYRLPKSMLKKLPILKYAKNNDLSYDTCVICLDEFVEGDKLRVLPCKHPYHSHCIDPWLTQNRRVCPICKRKVFAKGETRSNRNRQSSLDSVTDTDDDTTPLLQPASNSSVVTAAVALAAAPTSNHGTFRHESNFGFAATTGDTTTDDENVLLTHQPPVHSSRRVNPFDRAPNLPPHLADQLGENQSSVWSHPFLSFFRRPQPISVAAPPYLEEVVPEVPTTIARHTYRIAAPLSRSSAAQTTALSSNNILNPNLAGSFKDDDELPHQSIYEPIAMVTPSNVINEAESAIGAVVHDSMFIQTPSQGGIGVVALPNSNDRGVSESTNRSRPFFI